MSNNIWVIIAIIAYGIASIIDARSSIEMSKYGVREFFPYYWQFWNKKNPRMFFLPSYIVVTIAVVVITMVYSYPAYQMETIIVFFVMAGVKLVVGLVWNPYRLRKAKERQGQVVARFRGEQL